MCKAVGHAYNVLDNSYFGDPVNQRGNTVYEIKGYTIDRWFTYSADLYVRIQKYQHADSRTTGALQLINNNTAGISILAQRVPEWWSCYMQGRKFTLAAKRLNGDVIACSCTCSAETVTSNTNQMGVTSKEGDYYICLYKLAASQLFEVRINIRANSEDNGASIQWVALYEGEYTADTLPEYKPKGYVDELDECRRYFYKIRSSMKSGVITANGTMLRLGIPLSVPMRLREPTMTINYADGLRTDAGTNLAPNITSSYVQIYEDGCADVQLTIDTIEGVTNNTPAALYFNADLSADL